MKREVSLSHVKEPTIGLYREPVESSPPLHTMCLMNSNDVSRNRTRTLYFWICADVSYTPF
jgi:hypothetical protein